MQAAKELVLMLMLKLKMMLMLMLMFMLILMLMLITSCYTGGEGGVADRLGGSRVRSRAGGEQGGQGWPGTPAGAYFLSKCKRPHKCKQEKKCFFLANVDLDLDLGVHVDADVDADVGADVDVDDCCR